MEKKLKRMGKRCFEEHYDEWLSDSIYSSLEKQGYTHDSINTRISIARSFFKAGENEAALKIAKNRTR